jgi:hypothetical protein
MTQLGRPLREATIQIGPAPQVLQMLGRKFAAAAAEHQMLVLATQIKFGLPRRFVTNPYLLRQFSPPPSPLWILRQRQPMRNATRSWLLRIGPDGRQKSGGFGTRGSGTERRPRRKQGMCKSG